MPPRKRKGLGPRGRGVRKSAVPTAAPEVNDNSPPPEPTNHDLQNEETQTLADNTRHDKNNSSSDCVRSEGEQQVQSQTLAIDNSSDAANNSVTESAAKVECDTESAIKEGLSKEEEGVLGNDGVVTGEGNVEGGDERGSVGESAEVPPKKRVVRKVVKVVKKVVKKKVPKKVETGGNVECFSNELEKSEACGEGSGRKDGSLAVVSGGASMGGVAAEFDGENRGEIGQGEGGKDAKVGDFKEVGNLNDLPVSVSLEAMEVDGKDNGEIGGGKREEDGKVCFRKDIGNLNELPVSSPVEGSLRDGEICGDIVEEGAKVSVLAEIDDTKSEMPASVTDESGNANISEVPEERKLGSNQRDFHSGVLENCVEVCEVSKEVMGLDSGGDRGGECGIDNLCSSSGKAVCEETEEGGGSERFVWSGEMKALERRKRRKTEIFLGGLDKEVEEEDIRKIFEEVGDVMEVRLKKSSGGNKGYAFIRFATAADAKKALEKYTQVEICGKQCGIKAVEGNDTIFLGNINKKWKDNDVIELLSEIGIEKIDKVTVMSDPNNIERNRGFAFLELETYKDAQNAFKKLQKVDALGNLQGIKIAWAEPLEEPDEEEMQKVRSVYAEFIPSSWDEQRVEDYFKKFGEIENIVLARNLRSSKRKDFAFINFKDREAALTCIQSFKNGEKTDDGLEVNVRVSLAKPRSASKTMAKQKWKKHVTKELPKENQKTSQRLKLDEPRKKASSSLNLVQRQSDLMSSRTAEAVKFLREQANLREQATLRPSQPIYGSGSAFLGSSYSLSGNKRPRTLLEDELLYQDNRGHGHARLDNSFSVGSQRYSALSYGPGTTSPYYQHQGAAYPSGYGYADNRSTIQRKEAPYHGSSGRYYRY